MKHLTILLLMTMVICVPSLRAQETIQEEKADGYIFEVVKDIPTTSVKNQHRSGTCWSFSGLSFIESELIRKGKGEYDLSEMFVVRNSYEEKAIKYVRFQGNFNFGGGGAFHDVTHVMKNYGMVPEEAYMGLLDGEENHVHGELDALSKAYVDVVIKNKNRKLSNAWFRGYLGFLDAYLGKYPEHFTYNGKDYTPMSFAAELDINPDDYIEIGSYTHHPFYEKFIIEIPDNWLLDYIYNIPAEEMMEVINYSLENGYTVAWGSDVSEKGFSWKNGVAIVPEEDRTDLSGTEKEKWEKLTSNEKENAPYNFEGPVKEKTITQEMRQQEFDNYQTTDDHGMLITGMAKDQDGHLYYMVKNSWGASNHKYDGYFFASEAFVKLKTIDIMVHKDAIPKNIRKKLNL